MADGRRFWSFCADLRHFTPFWRDFRCFWPIVVCSRAHGALLLHRHAL
jgi:hypothetical protein